MKKIEPGDVIRIRNRESGMSFPALVDGVTKGGRVLCRWERHGRDETGLTKSVTLDVQRFEIVCRLDADEAEKWRKQARVGP